MMMVVMIKKKRREKKKESKNKERKKCLSQSSETPQRIRTTEASHIQVDVLNLFFKNF